MPKYTRVPALTGKQLIILLQKDDWILKGRTRHGVALAKQFQDRTKVTVVPDTKASLDEGTFAAILGVKQTGTGKKGLLDLVNRLGL